MRGVIRQYNHKFTIYMIRSIGKLTLAVILTAAVALAPVRASAQTNAVISTNSTSTNTPKATPKPKYLHSQGKIVAVDKVNMTITVGTKVKRVFNIDSSTKLTKQTKPATFEDFAVDDEIAVAYSATPDGKMMAKTIGTPARTPKAAAPAAIPPPAAKP